MGKHGKIFQVPQHQAGLSHFSSPCNLLFNTAWFGYKATFSAVPPILCCPSELAYTPGPQLSISPMPATLPFKAKHDKLDQGKETHRMQFGLQQNICSPVGTRVEVGNSRFLLATTTRYQVTHKSDTAWFIALFMCAAQDGPQQHVPVPHHRFNGIYSMFLAQLFDPFQDPHPPHTPLHAHQKPYIAMAGNF